MALMENLVAQTPPISRDGDGVVRVGGTRVRLETVIGAYENGCTPEEILFKYPALNLPDSYAVIAYYLARLRLRPTRCKRVVRFIE